MHGTCSGTRGGGLGRQGEVEPFDSINEGREGQVEDGLESKTG